MAIKEIFPSLPRASDLIGRMLMGYSELEISLMECLMQCLPGKFDEVFKKMFERQNADKRLRTASELSENNNRSQDFAEAIDCIDYCRKIRNQYAHNQWYEEKDDIISFLCLEEIVKELKCKHAVLNDFSSLAKHKADITLLEGQLNYFDYTERFLLWLRWELLVENDKCIRSPHQKPIKLERPKLCI